MAIGVMLMARPASTVYRVLGPRRMIATGLVIASLTSFAFLWIDLSTNLWYIRVIMLARGVGFGLMLVPLQAATFTTVRPSEMGRAGAIYNVGRQAAQSLGVAIIATVLTNRLSYHQAALGNPATRSGALDAFHDSFMIAGLLTLVGVVAALLIRDSDAMPSMRPRHVVPEHEEPALGAVH
jgi:MFS family permease